MLTNILATEWKNTELIGIFAGIFILVSFIPRKEYLIRSINIIGCILFSIYGIVHFLPGKPAWSIVVINTALGILQVVYLSIYFANLKKKKQSAVTSELKFFASLETKFSDNEEFQKTLALAKSEIIAEIEAKNLEIEKLNKKLNEQTKSKPEETIKK